MILGGWGGQTGYTGYAKMAETAREQSRIGFCVRDDQTENIENLLMFFWKLLLSAEILRVLHFALMQQAQMTTFLGECGLGRRCRAQLAAAPLPLPRLHRSDPCIRR